MFQLLICKNAIALLSDEYHTKKEKKLSICNNFLLLNEYFYNPEQKVRKVIDANHNLQ